VVVKKEFGHRKAKGELLQSHPIMPRRRTSQTRIEMPIQHAVATRTTSADQSASSQGLSAEADATGDSVEDLADTGQSMEAAATEGVEDASDHPERPTHTHEEYGRPEDVPPKNRREKAPSNSEGCPLVNSAAHSDEPAVNNEGSLRQVLYWCRE
jgi:hypothetical protein